MAGEQTYIVLFTCSERIYINNGTFEIEQKLFFSNDHSTFICDMKFPSWPTVKSSAAVELVAEEVGECPVTSVADFRGYFISDRREKS